MGSARSILLRMGGCLTRCMTTYTWLEGQRHPQSFVPFRRRGAGGAGAPPTITSNVRRILAGSHISKTIRCRYNRQADSRHAKGEQCDALLPCDGIVVSALRDDRRRGLANRVLAHRSLADRRLADGRLRVDRL